MIKHYFFLFVLAVFVVSCGTEGYVVKLTVEDESQYIGSYVYLSQRVGRSWEHIDSLKIDGNQLEFNGVTDSAKVVYIILTTKDGARKFGSLILENAVVDAKMDDAYNFTVRGTKQNNLLDEYYQIERKTDEEIKTLREKVQLIEDVDEEGRILNEIKLKTKQKNEDAIQFLHKNSNSLAGRHLFMSRFWMFDVKEKESIFEKMNEQTKSVERISQLIKATETEKRTSPGKQYVDFESYTPDGEKVSLSDYVGRSDFLLLDFWASWCGPCIRSIPDLKKLYDSTERDDLIIVGVSLDRDHGEWTAAIANYNLNWEHMSDVKYWESEAAGLYAVNSIPSTVLIDRTGKIIGRNMGIDELQSLVNHYAVVDIKLPYE